MPSAQPNLASWERRLLAGAIDAALLLVVGVFAYAALETKGSTAEALVFILACLFVVYQSASLLRPEYSLGRTVAGIVVLSFNSSAGPSVSQAIARPIVRLSLLAAAYAVGNLFYTHWLVAVPFALELALMAHTSWRRTIADLLVGTVVVNRPPMQPHRAPAYPMYSAKDEEFGPKP